MKAAGESAALLRYLFVCLGSVWQLVMRCFI